MLKKLTNNGQIKKSREMQLERMATDACSPSCFPCEGPDPAATMYADVRFF